MHNTATKGKKVHENEALKRGRRLEVKIIAKATQNSTESLHQDVVLSLKSPQSPFQVRNVELGQDEKGGGGDVVVDDGLVVDEDEKVGGAEKAGMRGDRVEDDEEVDFKYGSQTHTDKHFNNHDNNNYQADDDIDNNNNNNQGNNTDKITSNEIEKCKKINENSDDDSQRAPTNNPPNEDTPLTSHKSTQNLSQSDKRALIWKARKKKMMTYVKKMMGFLLSTLGLFILLFSYTILGGFIFHEIESPQEITTKHGVKASLKLHVELLWNSTRELNVLNKRLWSEMALKIIDNYTRVVYRATKNDGWDGKDDSEAELQWSFAGSLLYCVTVITTIGYGHIAPKTNLGRVVTIFYAIFGIPLCLLCITHVGGFMATVFRFLYKNIFCGLCCFCCNKLKNRKLERNRQTSEGSKDAAKGYEKSSGCCVCCVKKKAEVVGCTPSKEGLLANQTPRKPITKQVSLSTAAASRRLRQSYKTIVKWRRGIHNALFTDDNKNIQVPIYISLLLIGGYIALGALLFGLWENEWNFLIGSYFCFITLSTIGFGDFVPGTSLDPSSSQEKLVLCTLYLIVGLALLAMCFDLMQEEARSIFLNLGKRLGLIGGETGEKGSEEGSDEELVGNAESNMAEGRNVEYTSCV